MTMKEIVKSKLVLALIAFLLFGLLLKKKKQWK